MGYITGNTIRLCARLFFVDGFNCLSIKDPKIAKETTTFLNDDGQCPNGNGIHNWKYNTTLCQRILANPEILHPPEAYCCETFSDKDIEDWDKLTEECFAKNDDHVGLVLVNGLMYGSESALCLLKPISQ